jgi:glycosyltransferase involved in cell wall biosynthesis
MTSSPSRLAFFLPSLAGGGAERVMLNLAIGFAERGFGADLVLATAEGPYLGGVPSSVRVVDLKVPNVLRALRPLMAYLRRERPMALLAALNHANVVAITAARAAGARTRTVISIHNNIGEEMEVQTGMRDRAIKWLLGRLHGLADAVVAVSQGVADDLTLRTGIPRERVHVIYNPVIMPGLQEAASQPPPHPWFEDASWPIVLGVGRLTQQKNFPALIDAFALVRQEQAARLVILGEGPERAIIQEHVRRHQIEDTVALPGFVDNPYACMARAAVLALSSEWEGLPTVLIESLAVGTPVVSTDCPSGPREILRNGSLGTLVPRGDVAALATAITRTLRAGRVPPSSNGLRPFTRDVVLDQYQRVLEGHA